MTEPTEAQLELLRDKYVLWDRASREGPMDLRDYNRRAADALKAVLSVAQAAPAVPLSTISEGKPMPYFCPACQAIPAHGHCKLKGCPTAPAQDAPPALSEGDR